MESGTNFGTKFHVANRMPIHRWRPQMDFPRFGRHFDLPRSDGVRFLESFDRKEDSDAPQTLSRAPVTSECSFGTKFSPVHRIGI